MTKSLFRGGEGGGKSMVFTGDHEKTGGGNDGAVAGKYFRLLTWGIYILNK